ncbi:hypothetical protein CCO03_15005 [Comamonas serinivorans]|uniref:PilX/PilW C-terminal domain-containing protein n=1 Tax=Comamonas serinivorans TaxID=1082851 RepID=A0A1Y0ER83_9BURK|nr:PilX N-terminal domain-containing pilus assembly protein [Comamonas serinivorans]ARU05819.1 hypothetical protein CCO03_15005 [Comamonas serinivorans]
MRSWKKQTGISLFIVMVIVLLTAIVVAMGFKSSLFNETVTGNTAEYQRTYEAAQALVGDAELDIMRQSATGKTCAGTHCRTFLGPINDADAPDGTIYFPMADQLSEVQAALHGTETGCIAGICKPLLKLKDGQYQPYAFWDDAALLAKLKKRAAHYGQYTYGATSPAVSASDAKANPRLSSNNSWYWVEVLPYATATAVFGGTALAPTDMDAVYRITALVQGQRNTQTVIQKIVVGKSSAR